MDAKASTVKLPRLSLHVPARSVGIPPPFCQVTEYTSESALPLHETEKPCDRPAMRHPMETVTDPRGTSFTASVSDEAVTVWPDAVWPTLNTTACM